MHELTQCTVYNATEIAEKQVKARETDVMFTGSVFTGHARQSCMPGVHRTGELQKSQQELQRNSFN